MNHQIFDQLSLSVSLSRGGRSVTPTHNHTLHIYKNPAAQFSAARTKGQRLALLSTHHPGPFACCARKPLRSRYAGRAALDRLQGQQVGAGGGREGIGLGEGGAQRR